MKSKRAEEILDKAWTSVANTVWKDDAIRAVEIAEEHFKEKAIDAHIKSCPAYTKCEYTGHKLCRNKSGYDNKGVTYVDECKCKPDICTYITSFQSLINLGI